MAQAENPFYAALISAEDREDLRTYVPVDRDAFPIAFRWWTERTRNRMPRTPDRVQRVCERALAWAEANVHRFSEHSTNDAYVLASFRTCVQALLRIFIICDERDMPFDFVFAHSMLRMRDEYIPDPRRMPTTRGMGSVIHFAMDSAVTRPMREGRPLDLTLTGDLVRFGPLELLWLDSTRQMQDVCRMRVPMSLDCEKRAPHPKVRRPLRGVVYGPRDLAHVAYVDPFVMVVKFANYEGRNDNVSDRATHASTVMARAFSAAKHTARTRDSIAMARDVIDVRPLSHVGVGSYTKEDFFSEDDMACALLIRRDGAWVGIVHDERDILCSVTLDVGRAFNAGALDETDRRATVADVDLALGEKAVPGVLTDLVAQFADAAISRPDRDPEESSRRDEARKRKQ